MKTNKNKLAKIRPTESSEGEFESNPSQALKDLSKEEISLQTNELQVKRVNQRTKPFDQASQTRYTQLSLDKQDSDHTLTESRVSGLSPPLKPRLSNPTTAAVSTIGNGLRINKKEVEEISELQTSPPIIRNSTKGKEIQKQKSSNLSEQENEAYINQISRCLNDKATLKAPELCLIDIQSTRIQAIYNSELKDFKREIEEMSKILEPRALKFELLICLWVALHMNKLNFVRKLGWTELVEERERKERINEEEAKLKRKKSIQTKKKSSFARFFTNDKDDSPSKRTKSTLNNGTKAEDEAVNTSPERQLSPPGGKNFRFERKGTQKSKQSFSNLGDEFFEDQDQMEHAEEEPLESEAPSNSKQNRRNYIIEYDDKVGIQDENDLEEIRFLMKTEAAKTFNTNVLRIALNMHEEKIASIIVGLYPCKLDEEIILRAIKSDQLLIMKYMFLYNKNYEELITMRKFQKMKKYFQENITGNQLQNEYAARFKVFTIDYVIKKALDFSLMDHDKKVRDIASWDIKSTENLLKALLKNYKDDIAWYCLKNGIYTTKAMSDPSIINTILNIFKQGSKTELVLNVMMFMEYSKWSYSHLGTFIEGVKSIVTEGHEKNRIMQCYNPIMVICLSSEFMKIIGSRIKIFKHECLKISNALQILGQKIIETLDESRLSKVTLDRDFKDRTLIKIICQNGYKKLFSSYKIEILLAETWVGQQTFECDGGKEDISIITFLWQVPIKKLKGKVAKFRSLIDFNYKMSIKENKFWYQYKYRTTSIQYIFQKEFLSSIGMVCLFQYINFKYLDLFRGTNFDNFPTLSKNALAMSYIEEYGTFNYYGTCFSAALFIHQLQKLFYNMVAPHKISLDKWTLIDLFSSMLNIACFNYIGNTTPVQVLTPEKKMFLDYYVIFVTLASWLRFFSFFLVIRMISKLLHTLLQMLIDITGFVLILSCYFILMASIFSTLFSRPEKDSYGNMTASLRTLFDAFLGNYSYTEDSAFELSFSLLMMTHVFISNIFLLNFLVAILSTVYDIMIDQGEFNYKCNRYQYIDKYATPMLDTDYYREHVVHPPPLNMFGIFLVPFSFSKNSMRKMGKGFSKLIYWVENIPFIISFIIEECIFAPIIYFKILGNIIIQSNQKNVLPRVIFWLLLGLPVVIIGGVGLDTFSYMRVLCTYDEEMTNKKMEEEDQKHDRVVLYNEIIQVMRSLLYIYKRSLKEKKAKRKKKDFAQEYLEAYFRQEEEAEKGYTIDKWLLIEAWARYRPNISAPKYSQSQSGVIARSDSSPQQQRESPDGSPKGRLRDDQQNPQNEQRDLDSVFGEKFIKRILKGVKLKFYQGKEFDINVDNKKKAFKNQRQQRGFNNDLDFVNENLKDDFELGFNRIPKEEIQLVESFLDKFIFIQIGSTSKTDIDMKLTLNSLPIKVTLDNMARIDMINFRSLQKALIAFQNDDQDELFNHYDTRNKERLRKLKNKALETDQQSQGIKQVAQDLLYLVSGIIQKGQNGEGGRDYEARNQFIQGGINRGRL